MLDAISTVFTSLPILFLVFDILISELGESTSIIFLLFLKFFDSIVSTSVDVVFVSETVFSSDADEIKLLFEICTFLFRFVLYSSIKVDRTCAVLFSVFSELLVASTVLLFFALVLFNSLLFENTVEDFESILLLD